MISSICWVPKGAAKAVPRTAPLTEDELAGMRQEAAEAAAGALDASEDESEWSTDGSDQDMEGEAAAVAKAKAVAASMARTGSKPKQNGQPAAGADAIEAAMAELDMDHYDSDDGGGAGSEEGAAAEGVVSRALGGRGLGVVLDDPYQTAGGGSDEDEDDMDSEEREDFTIRPDDALILAAKNEDDVSTLEVWVYEEPSTSTGGEANLYVHHDVLLPAFPLCVAWMDLHPGGSQAAANVVAVGSVDPGIEVWDLDVVDQVEPAATLGGVDAAATAAAAASASSSAAGASGKARKQQRKKAKARAARAGPVLREGSHGDAVLGLSWNQEYRNVLASGSADCTAKVWDVVRGVAQHTLTHHTDKVQAVAWNPAESPVLLTGSFDRTACLVDARAPSGGASAASWSVSADVEAVAWDPHHPTCFLVSSEDGMVVALDTRRGAGGAPLFRLAAHDKPACALSFCRGAPGLLATASTDKAVKLWNLGDNSSAALLASKDVKLGALFAAGFCRDVPHLLAMAGAAGSVGVWDVRSCAAVAAAWPELMRDVAAEP